MNPFSRLRSNPLALQLVFISLLLVLTILLVRWITEQVLVEEALELEAHSFIEEYRKDPSFPLPRTRNLIGYLTSNGGKTPLPISLRQLPTGLSIDVFYSDTYPAVPVYVQHFDNQSLYLVYLEANVDKLVFLFGVLPLSVILILLYIGTWISYRLTWGAISPVLHLAKQVQGMDAVNAQEMFNREIPKLKGEVADLAVALQEYSQRIDQLIKRERQFTADASHELRTPVTILDGAIQMLLTDPSLSDKAKSRLKMMKKASRDLAELIHVFLLLARESSIINDQPQQSMVQLVSEEIEKLQPLVVGKSQEIELVVISDWQIEAPHQVVRIILSNLIRNAISYSEVGNIEIRVSSNRVQIYDNGPGIEPELLPHIFERHVRGRGHNKAGEGIGLSIVKRLVDDFDFRIKYENRPEGGLIVTLIQDAEAQE